MSDFYTKQPEYTKENKKRTISIRTNVVSEAYSKDKSLRSRCFDISLHIVGEDEFINLMTDFSDMDAELVKYDNRLIKYVQGLPHIKKLTDDFLNERPISDAVRELYKEEGITSAENGRYTLFFVDNKVPTIQIFGENRAFPLKNRHHLLPVILNIVNQEEIDEGKRAGIIND